MRFEPDFAGVTAYTEVFPRGDYELVFEEPKGFAYTKEGGDDDGKEVAGVTFPLTMVGKYDSKSRLQRGDLEGKDVTPIRLFVHSEGAFRMSKRVLMAALGYDKKSEETFNTEVLAVHSWQVSNEDGEDEDSVEIGDGYSMLTGRHVAVTLDKREYNGEDQQDFRNWRPVKQ